VLGFEFRSGLGSGSVEFASLITLVTYLLVIYLVDKSFSPDGTLRYVTTGKLLVVQCSMFYVNDVFRGVVCVYIVEQICLSQRKLDPPGKKYQN